MSARSPSRNIVWLSTSASRMTGCGSSLKAVVSFARQGAQLPSLSHVPGALVDVRVSFLALMATKKCRKAGESGSLYEIGPMTVWHVVFAYNDNGRSVDSCRH